MKAIITSVITLVMVFRAWSNATLTPAGIIAATLTAVAHAIHPWSLPFGLLIVFFLAGTRVTKIKKNYKSRLTINESGNPNEESTRTHLQVFANSGVASVLSLLHSYQLLRRNDVVGSRCLSWSTDLFYIGIVANYAAVGADTFSSELGILSNTQPRLITSLKFRKVPPGTNGGVTMTGILAGLLGSFVIVIATLVLTPFCLTSVLANETEEQSNWDLRKIIIFATAMTFWGALGSILDSFLGGWLQQSIIDTRSGKIIEGTGGKRVLLTSRPKMISNKIQESLVDTKLDGKNRFKISRDEKSQSERMSAVLERENSYTNQSDGTSSFRRSDSGRSNPKLVIESGSLGLLDNNQVNFVMALTMSVGAMIIASHVWNIPINSLALWKL